LTPLLTSKTPQGEGGYGTLYREGGTPKGVYRGVLMVIHKGVPLCCYMGKILTIGDVDK